MSDETSTTLTFDGMPLQPLLGGRYEMVERIGKGGMAEVFRGRDMLLKRDVAIKIMLTRYASDPSFARRFEAEAQAAAQLRSPHIVSIYDVGNDQGRRYIVMELVEGENLKSWLARSGVLSPRMTAALARQICLALEEAHAVGIVHRDVKPANIMLSHGRGSGRMSAQIMDFGIAKADRIFGSHSDDGLMMGTPQYMSPEQFRGDEATVASDLYSLGVVMYECCTGCTPFLGSTGAALASQHTWDIPIAPQQLHPAVDDELDAIIMQALEKEPAARFPSSAEMARRLEGYLRASDHPHRPLAYPSSWVVGFTTGPDEVRGRVFEVGDGCVIGRDPQAAITIGDESVSRQHVRLTPRGMFLEVADLASSNGTLVNGESLHGARLVVAGAECALGTARFRVGCRRP